MAAVKSVKNYFTKNRLLFEERAAFGLMRFYQTRSEYHSSRRRESSFLRAAFLRD